MENMKILICTDGSKISKNAISFGGLVAKGLDAEIVLLHVVENKKKDRSSEILEEGKNILKEHNLKVKTKIRRGTPELKIINEANKGYSLVVLGSHGINSIKIFLFGDVAYRVVQCVEIPVLIVRKKRKKLKKILVCCGGSKYAKEAIRFGAMLARVMKAKTTLLHVIPEMPQMFRGLGMNETIEKFLKTNTPEARILKDAAKLFEKEGLKTQVELRHGFPPEEILNQAEQGNYDLILMGSHGMFGVRRLLMGAVAYKVVQHSIVPCLLVKPKKFKFLSSINAYK